MTITSKGQTRGMVSFHNCSRNSWKSLGEHGSLLPLLNRYLVDPTNIKVNKTKRYVASAKAKSTLIFYVFGLFLTYPTIFMKIGPVVVSF